MDCHADDNRGSFFCGRIMMSPKLVSLATLVLVLGLVSAATASNYTDAGPTHLFTDPCNWDEDGVPDSSATGNQQYAQMTEDDTVCIIDSSMEVSAEGVYVGCYGGDNELYMTGGELRASFFNVGRGASHSGSVGYFKMTGGTLNLQQEPAPEFKVPNQFDGAPGRIIGHADLHGGDIWLGGTFHMGSREPGVYNGGIGTIDLAGTTLSIAGNATARIQEYIDNGWITAYGGAGEIELDWGRTTGQRTTLKATPRPERASYPSPQNTALDVGFKIVLNWTPGTSATRHDVYFGADMTAVTDATPASPEYKGSQTPSTYPVVGTLDLDFDTTYYWRIDEVSGTGTAKGAVWRFTTANYVVVDSFESYDDAALTNTWIAGGSAGPAIETEQVRSGRQAMRVAYSDTAPAVVSRQIANEDWTHKGIQALYIWFLADPNVAELSVRLNNDGAEQVVADIGRTSGWQELRLDLSRFDVNLGSISEITLKVTAFTGGAGNVTVDDIRLYPCVHGLLDADFNDDCVVDFRDFAFIADSWFETAIWP